MNLENMDTDALKRTLKWLEKVEEHHAERFEGGDYYSGVRVMKLREVMEQVEDKLVEEK